MEVYEDYDEQRRVEDEEKEKNYVFNQKVKIMLR